MSNKNKKQYLSALIFCCPIKRLLLFTALTLVTTFGCSSRTSDVIELREGPNYKFSNFITGIDKFPYEPSGPKKEKILKGFQSLRLKMRQEEVLTLLGEPDAEDLSYNKTQGGIFLESSWAYYLHRHEPELANEIYDMGIFVYFDTSGKLYWAVPDGIKGLTAVGSPLHRNS